MRLRIPEKKSNGVEKRPKSGTRREKRKEKRVAEKAELDRLLAARAEQKLERRR